MVFPYSVTISHLILLWSEHILSITPCVFPGLNAILLHLQRLVLQLSMYSTLLNCTMITRKEWVFWGFFFFFFGYNWGFTQSFRLAEDMHYNLSHTTGLECIFWNWVCSILKISIRWRLIVLCRTSVSMLFLLFLSNCPIICWEKSLKISNYDGDLTFIS